MRSATADDFRRHLFGPRPAAEAAIAEVAGEPVGFAPLVHDLLDVPRPARHLPRGPLRPARVPRTGDRQGASWPWLARLAVDRGCGRLEWSVLDWNEPAIGFYRALGARPMDEWTVYRLDDEPLAAPGGRQGLSTDASMLERIRIG